MSHIDDLIKQYCPDGVSYRKIGEFAEFKRGANLPKDQLRSGSVPVVTASRDDFSTHDAANNKGNCVTVTSHGAYVCHVNFWNDPIWLANNVYLIAIRDNNLESKFLYYSLKAKEADLRKLASSAGVPYINSSVLARVHIPVPPIEVQREIVAILDTFTQLEAELEAELEARRKQYEHYRNELLSFQHIEGGGPVGSNG